MPDKEILRFDDLGRYLLLKNGNYLYKVPFRGGWAVLKVYYCSRNWFRRLYKTFDNVVMCGQTSFMPRARLRNEQASMRVWREAGFRVFDIYENVEVEGLPRGGYALYEYVPGRNFHKFLPDESIPLEERLHWYRLFLEQWHRRHALACRTRNPLLIHENGDLKHVMLHEKTLYWFDFEMVFRSGAHIEDLVAREILAYLKTLGAFLPRDRFDLFFRETMERYPGREYLNRVYPYMFRNRNLFSRFGRWWDFKFRKRAQKPLSKYRLALLVRDYLATHPAPPGTSSPRDRLLRILGAYHPRLLDACARGTGWNSVWQLSANGTFFALKIYGRRRGAIRERLTSLSHALSGRTPYTAADRQETESACLRLWREAGFDVPAPFTPPADFPALPAPCLLMEYLPGPTLAGALADPAIRPEDKDALFRRFLSGWAIRHATAIERRQPALLQEQPWLNHILVSGDRLVTFDLEVAYTGRNRVTDCVAAEIAGVIRSLFKFLPPDDARHYVRLLAQRYPDRARLAGVYDAFFANPSLWRRLVHAADRLLLRKAGHMDKFNAALELRKALDA